MRNNNYFNNNNQSQKSFTPFPQLPPINNNNNYNTISNESYQFQNINPSRSSPIMPSLYNSNNYISTPYNNNNYNNNYYYNNDNSFNRYDPIILATVSIFLMKLVTIIIMTITKIKI